MSLVTFTQQLLENLVAERPSIEEQQRSVIFICQSLGSLVFKQAYFLAPEDTHYMDLQSKFGSIVFFGTLPHRGSNIASWSKMAALKRLELASLNTSNTQLTKDLEPSSKKLRYIWRRFTGYAPESNILLFRATRQTR